MNNVIVLKKETGATQNRYSSLPQWDLEAAVLDTMDPGLTENEIEEELVFCSPSLAWKDCYPVMDCLMALTGGVYLNADGTATAEIAGEKACAGGGHCRAICELYLMAHDAQKELQI